MKKLLTLITMAVLAMGTMLANWQPDDMAATRLDKQDSNGQVQMKTLRTDDGKIILSWLRPEVADGVFSYKLHLQLFDANGNARFGDEGIIVCDKPTRSWTTDYALDLADNGDIILGYTDVRNDPEEQALVESYFYRYTQTGEPVWGADGIVFPVGKIHETAYAIEDVAPQVCASGNNIFAAVNHTEYYREKATEDNWSPSPWFPNQEMPDSVDVTDAKWMIVQLNGNGEIASGPMEMKSRILVMKAASDGKAFFIYDNEESGLDAQLIGDGMENVWEAPLTIEPRTLSSGMFMPTPLVERDADGGLFLSYRVLNSWSGYQVLNHLNENGEFLANATICNGTEDGDAGSAAMGTKYDVACVAWEYDFGQMFMNVNVLDAMGNYCWPDELVYGRAIDENAMWGFKPVAVIPQEDGWVLLYGNCTSWNGASFMVVKIDDFGMSIWTKQIREDDFKSSGFAVTYDDHNAYIFFTQDEEYDADWEVIPGSGGMFVMCVDIAGGSTAVNEAKSEAEIVSTEYYTIDGRRVDKMEDGVNIIRMTDANGNVTTKKVLK